MFDITLPPWLLPVKTRNKCFNFFLEILQSGAPSLAKHGGAYFSAVYGSIKDPIAAPGLYGKQEP